MRSEYEYRGAGPLHDLAGRKNSMWFPSGCTNETGIYTDARVQHLRQIQQPQANNPFANKYSKDQCGKMRHNGFGGRDNVWYTTKGAAELIPAVPQGLELLYRSEIDGPFWLGEW
jgi:hypothetical protein